MCCDITFGSNIVGTASSFSLNVSENPTSNCALFVNESVEKWSEQRTKLLLMRSETSLQIKLIHSFLTLWSEERQCKDCFSTTWTAQNPDVFEVSLSFCFCIDLRLPLSLFTLCAHISGRGLTGSDVEADVDLLLRKRCLATLLYHRVVHFHKLSFWQIFFNISFFRLMRKFWVLKLTGCFYTTMTSYMSRILISQFMTPLTEW